VRDRQTDRRMDECDRQTDGWMNMLKQCERQTDRQIDEHVNTV